MAWNFAVETRQVKVHPGQMNQVNFTAMNPTNRDIVGQAVPSVSPGPAALYLNKTECFCFEQQTLKAGESVVMPMKFYVDPQLPEKISYFTERNGYRMPPSHRLDIAVTFRNKISRKFRSSFTVGIYNVYNQYNPYSITFQENEIDPSQTDAVQLSLFGIIPTVTWNFSF